MDKGAVVKSFNFSVSVEGNSYHLAFEPHSLDWRLVDVVAIT